MLRHSLRCLLTALQGCSAGSSLVPCLIRAPRTYVAVHILTVRPFLPVEKSNLQAFQILAALEENGSLSQRDLSRRLNVSLGSVNSALKRLVQQGFFEVKGQLANRAKYTLTDNGLEEKSRLAAEYFKYALEGYHDARQLIQRRLADLEKEKVKQVIIYGIGEIPELVYLCLQKSSLFITGVIDNTGRYSNFFGHSVLAPESLARLPEAAILISANMKDAENIINEIKEHGGESRAVYNLGPFIK